MAKPLTREQVKKWNSDCHNGFKFDLQYYAFHDEKTVHLHVPLGGDRYLDAHVMYFPEYITKTSEYGCKYKVATGKEVPNVHLSVFKQETNVAVSHGLGNWIPCGEPQTKKLFSVLQAATEQLTPELLLSMYDEKTAIQSFRVG